MNLIHALAVLVVQPKRINVLCYYKEDRINSSMKRR